MNANAAKILNNVEAVENDFAVTVGSLQTLGDAMNMGVPPDADSYQAGIRKLAIAAIERLIQNVRDSDALFGVQNELGNVGTGAGLLPA